MINIVGKNKTYLIKNEKFVALKDIHIKIDKPGLYVFIGESGSGKSTLLNCISGVDQWDDVSMNDVNGRCSFIFQDYHLFNHMDAYENVKFSLEINHNNHTDSIKPVFKHLLIDDIMDHEPNQLSGGQQQRVAIARAILIDKPFLLADEPTGNLDKKNAEEIAHILKEISHDKVVIVATHDLSLFMPLADEIYKLEHGGITEHRVINHSDAGMNLGSEVNKESLSIKHILKFASKGYKTKYSRIIILMLTLLISFLFALSATNILINDDYRIKEQKFKEEQISDVEFVKYKDSLSNGLVYSISNADIETIINQYNINNYMLFTSQISPKFVYEDETIDVTVSRIYRTTDINKKTISNHTHLDKNEIIITKELSSELITKMELPSVNDLIGMYILLNNVQLKIIDIIDQNVVAGDRVYNSFEEVKIEDLKHSIYMNEETYYLISHATDRDYIKATVNDSELDIRITDLKHSFYQVLAVGSLDLDDNEIVIDYDTAVELSNGNDIGQLIGNQLGIKIKQYTYNLGEPIDYGVESYIIKGIFQQTHEQVPWLFSEYEFNKLSFEYGRNNYQSNALNGIVIEGSVTSQLLKEFNAYSITDYSYISDAINVTSSYIDSVVLLISILAIILLVISILIIISYVNNSMITMKKEIGILKSLNIGMKDIMRIFVAEMLIILISTTVLVSIIHIFIVQLINKFLISLNLISFSYLYYNLFSIVIIFSIPVIITLIFMNIVSNKLKKMNSIELIRYN